MNYTIYTPGFNNADNKTDKTSINIKNNRPDKAQGVSFEGVIVSGMEVDRKKLDRNTYTSLLKETEDVKAQIMESAANAEANLKALFNRLSGADAVRINEDGFNLNDITAEEAVSILDKIKIELATYCEDYQITGSSVSVDKIKAVVGSAAFAESIVGKMEASGIPLTDDNVDDMANALKEINGLDNISEQAKNHLVSNNMEPSIENVHIAEAAVAGNEYSKQGRYGNGAAGGRGGEQLSDKQWEQLKPQIDKMLAQAGITPTQQDYNNAKTFISTGIPATAENLLYKHKLDNINFDNEAIVDNIINKMVSGGSAKSTHLTGESNIVKNVAEALNVLENVEYEHVEYACNAQNEKGEPVNLSSIEAAIAVVGDDAKNATTASMQSNQVASLGTGAQQAVAMNSVDASYKTILDVQMLLSAKSGIILERQGLSVMTTSIELLHKQLVAIDKEETMERIARQLSEDINGPEALRTYELICSTKRALFEIKYSPDYTIGAFVGEDLTESSITLRAFAEMGGSFKHRFKQANETYEAVGTNKRADLGDSMAKALKASTGDILNGLGMEYTKANADAVRILGYNSMEITEESINTVKGIHATLNSLINNMTPEMCLNMIRDGVNPMGEDIFTLNEYLKAGKTDNAVGSDDLSKYSAFLYKLDKTGGITDEERKQYIGIYKMMNMFTNDAGVAIGTLCKQNSDITMKNLCMAYNSRRHAGMDYTVDDKTDIKTASTKAYYLNLFDKNSGYVTPLTLKNVQSEKAIDSRSVEDFCEALENTYDAAEEAKYYEEYLNTLRDIAKADKAVLKEIEMSGEAVTVNNIETFKALMESASVGRLFAGNSRRVDAFLEKMDSRKAFDAEYEALKKASDKAITEFVSGEVAVTESEEAGTSEGVSESTTDNVTETGTEATSNEGATEVADSDSITYEQLRSKMLENNQITTITRLARKHNYNVPVMTEDGISVMKLTLVSDNADKGRISINFESSVWGKTSIEAKVTSDSVGLYGVCNRRDSMLYGKLREVADKIKSEYSYKEVTIYCNSSDLVNRIMYADAADKVATDRLYKMSKTIISNLI